MNITERKEVALGQKINALHEEFKQWIEVTETNKEFEKHNTQVRALTGHLSGLCDEIQNYFEQAKENKSVLVEARNLESLVLGLRRIWEFFRSKLVQRRDPKMRSFLKAADELAWACYRPLLNRCPVDQRREPPLVFLNGGLSPYALRRNEAFMAENVPGESLTGETYESILKRLPIPMIGVPWYQVAHLPDLPVIAHETGHAVEQDFGLHDLVLDNLKQGLGDDSPRLQHWKAWSKEVFADLWGCLTLGPAYVSSLVDFLAGDRPTIENEIATNEKEYPTKHLRVLVCINALDLMGFNQESARIESEWKSEYKRQAMSGFDNDILPVVKAILCTSLAHPWLTEPLLKIKELRFSTDDWEWAKKGAEEQDEGKSPKTANTIIRWAAAARYLFEKSPGLYAREKRGDKLLDYAEKLINPGTRAGEVVVNQQGKKHIFEESRQAGRKWFKDFAKWVNASGHAGNKDKDAEVLTT